MTRILRTLKLAWDGLMVLLGLAIIVAVPVWIWNWMTAERFLIVVGVFCVACWLHREMTVSEARYSSSRDYLRRRHR